MSSKPRKDATAALSKSAPQGDTAAVSPDSHDALFADLQILVIDDDAFEQKLITTILKKLGANKVEAVDGGRAALERLRDCNGKIDVAICDLMMPDIDGLEFVRRISGFSKTPAIIFASGADNPICRAAEQIADQLGVLVIGSVLKPVSPDSLTKLLSKLADGNKTFKHLGAFPELSLSADQVKAGLNGDKLVMYYQPKISVKTGEVVGFESLARWRDDKLGILGPASFIPTIARCGLLNRLTDVVIFKTLSDFAPWSKKHPEIQVSINVDAENLSNFELPNFVINTAKPLFINPNRITLEVTESGVANDATTAMEILTRLRLNDVRLSIDDFGTGYASLDKLKDLPFNELKIDRGFVQDATANDSAMALLEFACELGKKLGLHIVAEGVETQSQWQLVSDLGCDAVQGFLISKPMPADEVLGWIANWNSRKESKVATN